MKPRNAHATKEKHLFWLKEPVLLLLPYAGMAIFVILYVIAALEYPGGSYAEPNVEGFSFWHNYLCDLLDKRAINGSINTARYHARWSF